MHGWATGPVSTACTALATPMPPNSNPMDTASAQRTTQGHQHGMNKPQSPTSRHARKHANTTLAGVLAAVAAAMSACTLDLDIGCTHVTTCLACSTVSCTALERDSSGLRNTLSSASLPCPADGRACASDTLQVRPCTGKTYGTRPWLMC